MRIGFDEGIKRGSLLDFAIISATTFTARRMGSRRWSRCRWGSVKVGSQKSMLNMGRSGSDGHHSTQMGRVGRRGWFVVCINVLIWRFLNESGRTVVLGFRNVGVEGGL